MLGTAQGRIRHDQGKQPLFSNVIHFVGGDYTFWMCSLDVRFTVACVFGVNFEFKILKITLKTHETVKRTSKLHIQNAGVIDP
jgi:hypothetical protein